MFGTQNLTVFLLAAIALSLLPGQDTLYIIGRSVSQGREAGIVSVLAYSSGCVVHILAAAIGFYALLALFPFTLTAICVAGGLYLIWLGIMALSGRHHTSVALEFGDTQTAAGEIYRQGVFSNLLNVKVALFFLVFLPQFIDPVSNMGSLSFLFLGSIFLFTSTIWCLFVAISASTIADIFRRNPEIQRGFDYFTCILFIGLGTGIMLGPVFSGNP